MSDKKIVDVTCLAKGAGIDFKFDDGTTEHVPVHSCLEASPVDPQSFCSMTLASAILGLHHRVQELEKTAWQARF